MRYVESGPLEEIGSDDVAAAIRDLKNTLEFATPIERKELLKEHVTEIRVPRNGPAPAGSESGRAVALHRNGDPEGSPLICNAWGGPKFFVILTLLPVYGQSSSAEEPVIRSPFISVGYIQSLTLIPHLVVTQIVGALLAGYYFWKKYGRQQWRLYAAVLVVGFSVGMALVGMASVSIAMIKKSVSVLKF